MYRRSAVALLICILLVGAGSSASAQQARSSPLPQDDQTTGSVLEDAVYPTRYVSCEELRTLVVFLWPADIELALAILRERCPSTSTAPPGWDS